MSRKRKKEKSPQAALKWNNEIKITDMLWSDCKCSGRHSWLIRNYNIQWQKLCPLIVLSKICQTTQEPVISNRVHHTVYSKLLSHSATHEEKVGFLWDWVKKSYIYKYCKQQHAQGISSNCENKLHPTLMNSFGSVNVANAKLQLETKSFRVAAETLTCKVSCSPACYTFYVDCICIAYRPTNRAKVLKQPCLHEINRVKKLLILQISANIDCERISFVFANNVTISVVIVMQ